MMVDIPDAPQKFQVSNMSSSPPLVSETIVGLTIYSYTINCSTVSSIQGSTVKTAEIRNATLSNLLPFAKYNCCVAVNSNNGRGHLACLDIVTGVNNIMVMGYVLTQ